MTRMAFFRGVAASAAVAAASSGVLAQTAIVTTSVNNGGTATIEPGGTVSVSVRIAHTMIAVAGIQGGTVIDGNAGVGSNFATTIPNLPTVNLGSFVGGSRTGADIAFTPLGFGHITPPSGSNPMPVWTYDVTLNEPGVYDIVWVPTVASPNVRLYASVAAFSWVEAQTTYVGARITVVPGSGTLPVVCAIGVLSRRGRRERSE